MVCNLCKVVLVGKSSTHPCLTAAKHLMCTTRPPDMHDHSTTPYVPAHPCSCACMPSIEDKLLKTSLLHFDLSSLRERLASAPPRPDQLHHWDMLCTLMPLAQRLDDVVC